MPIYDRLHDDQATVIEQLPQPSPSGSDPLLIASLYLVRLLYTPKDRAKTAVLTFKSTVFHHFGWPSDNSLSEHPLFGYGLLPYAVHEVEPSTLVAKISKKNKGASTGADDSTDQFRHFVLTFHDSSFECVAASVSCETVNGEPTIAAHQQSLRLFRR